MHINTQATTYLNMMLRQQSHQGGTASEDFDRCSKPPLQQPAHPLWDGQGRQKMKCTIADSRLRTATTAVLRVLTILLLLASGTLSFCCDVALIDKQHIHITEHPIQNLTGVRKQVHF